MMPSILYSDMDGTLISEGTISQENRDALRALVEAGGDFSIATGRSEEVARPYLGGLPLTLPAILYNGAAVYDYKTESFLYKACLASDTVAHLVEIALLRYPEVCVQAFTGGQTRMLNPNGLSDPYVTREKQPTRPSTLAEALAAGCFKLLF